MLICVYFEKNLLIIFSYYKVGMQKCIRPLNHRLSNGKFILLAIGFEIIVESPKYKAKLFSLTVQFYTYSVGFRSFFVIGQ